MIKLTDKEKNLYTLEDNGRLVLSLAEKPRDTPQHIVIGWLVDGQLTTSVLKWMATGRGWLLPRFLLLKTGTFGLEMICIKGLDAAGTLRTSYIHPKFVVKKWKLRKEYQREYQLLCQQRYVKDSRKEARAAYKAL